MTNPHLCYPNHFNSENNILSNEKASVGLMVLWFWQFGSVEKMQYQQMQIQTRLWEHFVCLGENHSVGCQEMNFGCFKQQNALINIGSTTRGFIIVISNIVCKTQLPDKSKNMFQLKTISSIFPLLVPIPSHFVLLHAWVVFETQRNF